VCKLGATEIILRQIQILKHGAHAAVHYKNTLGELVLERLELCGKLHGGATTELGCERVFDSK